MSQPLRPLSFPLRGTRLIEASAGTGKTFTIAALYVRLVLNHGGEQGFGRALTPAEILVVTFTKAATEELRDRIRRNLAEAARMFRGEPVAHPFLSQLQADYPADQHAGLARRLELAANSMDDAAIFTIHGWAQRMLRQHAFDSGRAFTTDIEEDLDHLWQEAARDYWRSFAYPLDHGAYGAFTDALGSVEQLAGLGRQYPRALHRLDDDCFKDLAAWEAHFRELELAARKAWTGEEQAILGWFETALAEGRLNRTSHKDEAVREQLRCLSAWAAGDMAFDAGIHGKLGSRHLKLKKGVEGPGFAALDLLSDLSEQQSVPEHISDTLRAHAAAWCHQRVEVQKRRRARMTFDDMLQHLDEALQGPGGPRLTATIRQHYPVGLIDEFQDTDPGQYRIFRQVYGQRSDLGFFMIGDPKQAIYGFRGADIYTYLAARKDSLGQHYSLGTNFRSVPSLVSGVNQMFGYTATVRPQGAFLLGEEIPFEPVDSREKTERLVCDGQPLAGLTLWSLPDMAINNKDDYLATLAASCASEIRRLLSAARAGKAGFVDGQQDGLDGKQGGLDGEQEEPWRALQPSDIAILVRDFNEAAQIRRALAQRGLRSAYLSDRESVFATAEAADLLTWLRAVAEPEREDLIRDALANRTLDLDLALLDIHNEDELAWEARVEQFRNYRRLWQERGVLPLIRHLMDDFSIPRQLLAQADGERTLTNLLQLAELLQAHATQLDGEQALIRFLGDQIESGGKDLGEEAILRLESDDDLIKVVTFHKSKGLEYPLVYIPFAGLCRPFKKGRGPLIPFHDEQGIQRYGNADDKAALEHADRERLAEDLRLLYVALTRPRFACWVGLLAYGQETKSKGYSCKLAPSALAYILSGGQPLPPETLWQTLTELGRQAPDITLMRLPEADDRPLEAVAANRRPKPPRERQQPPAPPWWITSYSAVLVGAAQTVPGAPEVNPPDDAGSSPAHENASELRHEPAERSAAASQSLHGLPRGAVIGNFLHAILEWMAEQGFEQMLDDGETLRHYLEQQCLRHDLKTWTDVLLTSLRAILKTPLKAGSDEPVPALGQLPAGSYRAELEFLFATHSTDSQALDQLVSEAILPGRRRPRLRPQTLNGMLKGYIDLVFEHNGRYYVLDYKSNWLGEDDAAYTDERMGEAMLEHRYDLQYALYILALHRLLKARMPEYDYETHMGGAFYLFLRGVSEQGQGIYADRPPQALIAALDQLFRADTSEVDHAP
jgi:exodeoxyribonuclease V beta subunit